MSKTKTSPSSINSSSATTGDSNEEGSLVWIVDHGHGRDRLVCPDAVAVGNDERPSRPVDARPDRDRDHARVSDRLYPDGHGRAVYLVRLPQRQSRSCGPADAGPDGAAGLCGDV